MAYIALSLWRRVKAGIPPTGNFYVAEDNTTVYVAEDGTSPYITEA